MTNASWPKRITVERKIVNLLSRSLYSDFPRAIREAVSNSYDADATLVTINVDLKNNEITIKDNGVGMSVEQFDNYLRIAGTRSDISYSDKFQRKRIGRFGIGFLACFPFCNYLEISSKREGSETGFTANISTKRFVEYSELDEDISSIPIEGFNENYSGRKHEHFTIIKMAGLTALVKEYFTPHQQSKRRVSIESLPGMEKLRWQLEDTLPLDYANPNSEFARILGGITGMDVYLNGQQLFRYNPGGQVLASTGNTKISLGRIEFKYAIATDWKIIHPIEARGLKLRLNGVGIGPRTFFEIEKEVRTFSRLNWLTGEIHVLKGLDDSLAITRDNFIWSPDYQAIKDFFFDTVLLRVHNKVENVATIERDMDIILNEPRAISAIPKDQVIKKSLSKLEYLGFDIVHRQELGNDSNKPFIVDKRHNRVIIHDGYKENETEHDIKITNFKDPDIPVRRNDTGTIEINTSYPLFAKKTKGDFLKRIHILLLLAKEECKTVNEMYDFLLKKIRESFE